MDSNALKLVKSNVSESIKSIVCSSESHPPLFDRNEAEDDEPAVGDNEDEDAEELEGAQEELLRRHTKLDVDHLQVGREAIEDPPERRDVEEGGGRPHHRRDRRAVEAAPARIVAVATTTTRSQIRKAAESESAA